MKSRLVAALVTLAVTLGGLATAQPASALRTSSVTIQVSKPVLLAGTTETFSGAVKPAATQRAVHLQMWIGSKWTTIANRSTTNTGAYSIKWVIAGAGYHSYRVTVSASKTATGAVSPKVTVLTRKWHYLADMNSVADNCGCQTGNAEINGTSYLHSVYDAGTRGSGVYVEYNLARKCVTFSAEVGIVDDSSSAGAAVMEIGVDGNSIFSQQFGLGQSAQVTRNITGHLRLHLDWTNTNDSNYVDVGYGNAKILCNY